ncbi:3'-5' exonuclease [Teredinibacter turnerae]|uniref:3'-5' exonuclease n=1 Tax=Teredinibacter turnerae TaxID=2426 RepID=UPI0003655F43|nr:3'-5' exonuclease [Teredinibacter turnerae]
MAVFYSLSYRWQKKRYGKAATKTPLAGIYQATAPASRSLMRENRFLVVDCEMSGLDASRSQLLSIGWVVIENARISHASGKHLLIHADRGAGESTRIHGLHDATIAGAKSAAAAITLLAKQVPGSVLVFHHAPLDLRFLQQTAYDNFRCPLLFGYVDTMLIEQRRLQLQGAESGLRLAQCRERYGLPPISGHHNAMTDARATAELLLAQTSYLGGAGRVSLGRMGIQCSRHQYVRGV